MVSCKKICNYIILIFVFVFIVLAVTGCSRTPNAVEASGNAAHQQIEVIRESLPVNCKTKAIQKQLESADFAVEAVVSNCEAQERALRAEKNSWKLLFFLLIAVILTHVIHKVAK